MARTRPSHVRIDDAGWHLSFFADPEGLTTRLTIVVPLDQRGRVCCERWIRISWHGYIRSPSSEASSVDQEQLEWLYKEEKAGASWCVHDGASLAGACMLEPALLVHA